MQRNSICGEILARWGARVEGVRTERESRLIVMSPVSPFPLSFFLSPMKQGDQSEKVSFMSVISRIHFTEASRTLIDFISLTSIFFSSCTPFFAVHVHVKRVFSPNSSSTDSGPRERTSKMQLEISVFPCISSPSVTRRMKRSGCRTKEISFLQRKREREGERVGKALLRCREVDFDIAVSFLVDRVLFLSFPR